MKDFYINGGETSHDRMREYSDRLRGLVAEVLEHGESIYPLDEENRATATLMPVQLPYGRIDRPNYVPGIDIIEGDWPLGAIGTSIEFGSGNGFRGNIFYLPLGRYRNSAIAGSLNGFKRQEVTSFDKMNFRHAANTVMRVMHVQRLRNTASR